MTIDPFLRWFFLNGTQQQWKVGIPQIWSKFWNLSFRLQFALKVLISPISVKRDCSLIHFDAVTPTLKYLKHNPLIMCYWIYLSGELSKYNLHSKRKHCQFCWAPPLNLFIYFKLQRRQLFNKEAVDSRVLLSFDAKESKFYFVRNHGDPWWLLWHLHGQSCILQGRIKKGKTYVSWRIVKQGSYQ